MGQKSINLKSLTMDELAGVVNLYPWFAAARKELCIRMSGMGGTSWGISQYADQAMYLSDRKIIADIMMSGTANDYSDANIESLLESYIDSKKTAENPEPAMTAVPAEKQKTGNRIGGDFFSRAEYEKVSRPDDNFFKKEKFHSPVTTESNRKDLSLEFCTETLAEIYAEQGYFEQSKRIYNKLLLAFPEKSAYFATLIDKLNNLINNQTL